MKLDRLRMNTVSKAVEIYLDLAYGGGRAPRRLPDLSLPPDAGWDDVRHVFQQEVVEEAPGQPRVRYALRLGNRNYPFMKLLLQEHLVRGEYFFAVDTHDDMEIKPDFPDYEAWMAVRRFNGELKRRIEGQLSAEGLPTAADLRRLVARREEAESGRLHCSVLVVDDEEDLAEAVEALLRARGCRVSKVYDGRAALAAAEEMRPDLILLDYELPEMDGLEVIAALRERESTREIPVLLTTASRISLEDIRKAEGFLAKPYHEELLYKVVRRLLAAEKR